MTLRDGVHVVQIVGLDRERKTIRLSGIGERDAKRCKLRIEDLLSARRGNAAPSPELAAWLAGLPDDLYAKLARAGLCDPRPDRAQADGPTLGEFLTKYTHALSVKDSTKTFVGHTVRNLRDFFGEQRALRSIAASGADSWRAWLVIDEKLAPATVSRRVRCARTIWRKAIRWELLEANPFEGMRTGLAVNEARKQFVSCDVIARVLEAAPDAEWRAIIGLSRFGGLRCPSEVLALRWHDLDWDRGTIRVRSIKTEHHAGRGERVIPMFARLRPLLLAAFDAAPDGAEYVITKSRDPGVNWRTTFEKIIDKAGVEAWPKLFHNLRASFESELMREYDLATVCRWTGHTPSVAATHYAMSVDLDADFRRATGLEPAHEALHKALHAGAKSSATEGNDENTQNAKRTPLREIASGDALSPSTENVRMGPVGLEPTTSRL